MTIPNLPADEQVVRIPNLPMGHVVDKEGLPTDDELTFRQTLITNLQRLIGNDGVVLPSLTSTQITDLENQKRYEPGILANAQYSTPFGTLVYDKTTNQIKASIDDGTGKPIFKIVNLI